MKPLAITFVLVGLTGCPWVRETALSSAPNLPAPSGCAPRDQRCNGAVPEVCSGSTRWMPALAVRADGTQRTCAGGCAVTPVDGGVVAHCTAPDAGTDGGAS